MTTMLILRAIAEVARRYGEDLTRLDARMECVAVLGLSGGPRGEGLDVGYFAARAARARLVANAVRSPSGGGVGLDAHVSGLRQCGRAALRRYRVGARGRLGAIASERAAASALPVLGALRGATLNLSFVRHFERAAHAHFSIRRLERVYGAEVVHSCCRGLRLVARARRR
jgi:hypothetical protein